MGGRRVRKYLVRGSLCSIAAIIGAQIYAIRELLAILLMLWLSFLVVWIGWRGLNSLAARATPILIRWRHPMVRIAAGIDSRHAPK